MQTRKLRIILQEREGGFNHKELGSSATRLTELNLQGYWTVFFPAMAQLQKEIESDTIGEPLAVHATFGYDLKAVPRITEKNLGGGGTLDLGCYTLLFSQLVFKGEASKSDSYGSSL